MPVTSDVVAYSRDQPSRTWHGGQEFCEAYPAHLAQSEAVFQALAQFLHDSLAAERVTLAGAVRIVLNLLADLCAMLTHQYDHTAAEVEARIDRLSSPLRSQIMAYHRRRD